MIADTHLWSSLPVPALLLSVEDTILGSNPAAEAFLNLSAKSLRGAQLWDKVMIDAALEAPYARAKELRTSLFLNDVDVGSGMGAPMLCNVQFAPLGGTDDQMIMMISPREIASRMTHSGSSGKAAKSAIGMAEMLAHEIKNPLAGITGAAQLLSMNLAPQDQEMTDLIVEESRRIVKLLEQVEQFGNLRQPQRRPVNIHDVLDRARQSFYDAALRVRQADGTHARLPLQIEVIDDGPGLPAEIANDIFEPFVSGRENGTGLGLALVSKLIHDGGGWITVESVPGKTVFRVSLPRATKD